ncbi:MAG: hypothetical protein UU16_C0039G0013 [Candidatus Woesebacteria bacterium GW2011_GWA2_40_7]|uniref:Uncharacterized protein n=3 Tax=Candidatus Woeseibacteriota TaxID=1752722 RepID=A0A0G0UYB4_9BACT|nr:MAG: hypothetical protein UT17_C0002G0118 [Candidatus Woesebacteria bacterium GW2011_GWB1_39_10]KKR72561.1 MAG: hypothetical protein UU16_C0039G0013 [Candidatus Woesebacteria bacterium GW2011_GWA2_40_7]KKR92531.1 MAG: hypothetical protein UU42_C0001G0135 [Candidatus Woesebacteria bacterium GW2011_GWA1_41_13b]
MSLDEKEHDSYRSYKITEEGLESRSSEEFNILSSRRFKDVLEGCTSIKVSRRIKGKGTILIELPNLYQAETAAQLLMDFKDGKIDIDGIDTD